MTLVFFDIEVYKNFYLISFKKDNIFYNYYKYNNVWYKNKDLEDYFDLIIDKQTDYLVGFNIKAYDLLLLSKILEGCSNEKAYEISNDIIKSKSTYDLYNKHFIKNLEYDGYQVIDLIKVFNGHASLKTLGNRVHFQTIENLPYDIEKPLEEDQIETVIQYCVNDVKLTEFLYEKVKYEVQLRFELYKEYEINALINSSNAQIAEKILTKYLKKNEVYKEDLKYEKPNGLEFEDEQLQAIINNLEDFTDYKDKIIKVIQINNGYYKMGEGGLHSQHEENKYYISNDNVSYVNLDVVSYYPSIIVNNNFYPKEKFPNFLDVYKKFLNERKRLKETNGDKYKIDAYKIILNGTFGKLNSEYSELYSRKSFLNITINGQLFLLKLIEMLEINNFIVVSSNTDGLVVRVPNSLYDNFKQVCEDWMNLFNFELEYNILKKIFYFNVNNYVSLDENDIVKRKGWFEKISLYRGSEPNIIKQLVIDKLLDNNIDLFEQVEKYNDIEDYVYLYTSTKFQLFFRDVKLGKVVRFIKGKSEDTITYVNMNNNISKVPNSDNCIPTMRLTADLIELVDKHKYVELATNKLKILNIKKIIPCYPNTKKSMVKGWNKDNVIWKGELPNNCNIAWILGDQDFILDIDIKTDELALENAKKFCFIYDIPFNLNVKTPSGGYHMYLRKSPKFQPNKKYLSGYEGVEFKYKGSYVLLPGSRIEGVDYISYNDNVYTLTRVQEKSLSKLFITNTYDLNLSKNPKLEYHNYSSDDVRDILNKLEPDLEYSEWFKVIIAVRDWSQGSDEGFELCEEWSKRGSKYDEEAEDRLKTIYYKSKYRDEEDRKIDFTYLLKKKSEMIKLDVIRMETDDNVWYKEWGILSNVSQALYINFKTKTKLGTAAFNNYTVNEYKPYSVKGKEMFLRSTTWLEKQRIRLRPIEGFVYDPRYNDTIIEKRGFYYLNEFDEEKLPKPDDEYTDNGKRAIGFFKRHCKFFDEGKDVIINYIAHIFQRRGVRIRWFLLLGSRVTGVGKTFIVDMVKLMLGPNNYTQISKVDLRSNFNSYADSKLFVCMDEYGMSLNKTEKEDIQDKLKVLITDDEFTVTRKFAEPVRIKLFSNGIFTTNKKDCLNDPDTDRRFYVSYLAYNSIEEVMSRMKMKNVMDFNKEIGNCKDNYKQVLKFLLEDFTIDDAIFENKRAPSSNYKKDIILESRDDIVGYDEAVELIKTRPCFFYNEYFVVMNRLIKEVMIVLHDRNIRKNIKNSELKEALGYTCGVYANVTYEGSRYNLYFSKVLSREEQLEYINEYRNNKE